MRGLRGRFVVALILTSALSLAIAGAALLPPLEHRLEREQLRSLVASTTALTPVVSHLRASEIADGPPRLGRLFRLLGRRVGARVGLVDTHGRRLAGGGRRVGGPVAGLATAFATHRPVTAVRSYRGRLDFEVAVPTIAAGRRIAIVARRSSGDAALAAQVVRRAFLLAGLIGLAISALVGFAITERLLRRLQGLRRVALTVAEEGPDAQVPADSARDEVGDLGRALSTMQTNLRRQERVRRAFVSTASHELRTPLALLQLTLELLEDSVEEGSLDREEIKQQLSRARAQSARLGRLAAVLLDLSRLDAGLALRSEPVDVIEVCRAVVAEFESRVTRGGSLRLDAGEHACWARGDPTAVARILAILLDNGLRHTLPDGAVTVEVRNRGPLAVVAVADTGPGVPPGDRARIFERFQRGDAPAGEGFGLGLAIGSDLARMMSGRLVLAHSGAGARFELELPRSASPVGEPPDGDPDLAIAVGNDALA